MLCPQNTACPYIFVKKVTYLSVGMLMICQVFSLCYKMCVEGLQEFGVS